ncbi:hypothetical protein CRG98_040835 [Punica granatum]|uniref:Uncharacterized protein n=1 Tax=Punica granatum TaxID=22663 RepID=A0A2I0I483_PUNGR|nr:hypothetical protein CRG98_040835 [Punica granatum]
MDLPWFDQVDKSSSSRNKKHNHQDLPPKKRFCIKSSLTAWRPDPRQQLILDNLWASIKNPQKGEESINTLVLHLEEQCNSKASLQQELCQKINSLQQELSLQKAQTHAFLQNSQPLHQHRILSTRVDFPHKSPICYPLHFHLSGKFEEHSHSGSKVLASRWTIDNQPNQRLASLGSVRLSVGDVLAGWQIDRYHRDVMPLWLEGAMGWRSRSDAR